MIPAPFDYVAPDTLTQALRALADHGEDARLLAGGQSLLPLLKLRLAHPKLLIDLARVPGLNAIRREKNEVVIGALATHQQIETSVLLKKSCPLLPQTASVIGDVQVRNRGTLGGSLVHADPGGDWPAAIMALGGELTLRGSKSTRRIAAEQFFIGALTTAIEPNEILTEIRVPVSLRRCGSAYAKMSQQASGFAIVGVAVALRLDGRGLCDEIGIGVAGLGDRPFRARAVEERLRGSKLTANVITSSAAQVSDGVEPLDDRHAAAPFRAHLAQVLAARAIRSAVKAASGKH